MKIVLAILLVLILVGILYGFLDGKDTIQGVDTPLESSVTNTLSEEDYYEQVNYCGPENYWETCNYDNEYEDHIKQEQDY